MALENQSTHHDQRPLLAPEEQQTKLPFSPSFSQKPECRIFDYECVSSENTYNDEQSSTSNFDDKDNVCLIQDITDDKHSDSELEKAMSCCKLEEKYTQIHRHFLRQFSKTISDHITERKNKLSTDKPKQDDQITVFNDFERYIIDYLLKFNPGRNGSTALNSAVALIYKGDTDGVITDAFWLVFHPTVLSILTHAAITLDIHTTLQTTQLMRMYRHIFRKILVNGVGFDDVDVDINDLEKFEEFNTWVECINKERETRIYKINQLSQHTHNLADSETKIPSQFSSSSERGVHITCSIL